MGKIDTKLEKKWSIKKAEDYYYVPKWGSGYFAINSKGNLSVQPSGSTGPHIDITDVIKDLESKDIALPCIIRFQDILRSRVVEINEVFRKVIREFDYKGSYFGVYPIKVNQMREVVEEILDAGSKYHFGLEAGSKTEILPVLAFNTDPEALTICNGYKDDDYLRLALLGRKLGRKVIVVVEKLSELKSLIRLSEEMDVEPLIGIRARLSAKSKGKWEKSSGEKAKFGLTISEILSAVELINSKGLQKSVKLFHFHLGSQITDIRSIKNAVTEGTRIYSKLHHLGMPIEYFDVGGGLGIDYDGSQSIFPSSMNYTLEQYISDVVYIVQNICKSENVPEPNLVSESGRSITAHHSCLVTNVFSRIQTSISEDYPVARALESNDNDWEAQQVKEMREILHLMSSDNLHESFLDAVTKKEETLSAFNLGILKLEDRAKVETLYSELLRRISAMLKDLEKIPEDLEEVDKFLSSQYLGNFSLFQNMPDHWACDQLFPVMPLHRLNEYPTVEASLVDITCDSDGKIDQFIDFDDVKQTIKLHALNNGDPYYIGMFLLGAYQEIMGDLHNCYGRVNEAHIFMDEDDPEEFYVEEIIKGDTAEQVLSRLQYSPSELTRMVKTCVDKRVRTGHIRPREGVSLIDSFEDIISGYTYLRKNITE